MVLDATKLHIIGSSIQISNFQVHCVLWDSNLNEIMCKMKTTTENIQFGCDSNKLQNAVQNGP